MVTQLDIAKRCGLDCSSVNKILNDSPGPVFNKKTIDRVKRVAKQMGYKSDRPHKGKLNGILRALFPRTVEDVVLSTARGISLDEVRKIKGIIYPSA